MGWVGEVTVTSEPHTKATHKFYIIVCSERETLVCIRKTASVALKKLEALTKRLVGVADVPAKNPGDEIRAPSLRKAEKQKFNVR